MEENINKEYSKNENKEFENILSKAEYCLNCKVKPCSAKGCPLQNNIPDFIHAIREKNIKKAYEISSKTTVLQSICGRICPHMKQCQGSCVRGIKGESVSIGELEKYVGDIALKEGYKLFDNKETENYNMNSYKKENNKYKIAIIGGGPAGITCSAFLAKKGYNVTIYEKYNYLGGLLVHGIPEFRLPKGIVKKAINKILELGINVRYNMELGKNIQLSELEKEYDAIFLCIGANVSTNMGVQGENLSGVYGGNELLENSNFPDFTGKKVAIIGGGNVAMDCARTIKRQNAENVYVIYRRAEKQMPAELKEIKEAKEEGVQFLFQNNIVKILGKEKVEELELIKTELIKKEGEDREVPINIEGSNYKINMDYVIMALGSKTSDIVSNLKLELNKWGYINTNEKKQTSNPKIFAGGDVSGNKSTVAWASRSGRDAAEAIDEFLNSKIDN